MGIKTKKHYNPDGSLMTDDQMKARIREMLSIMQEGLGIIQPPVKPDNLPKQSP